MSRTESGNEHTGEPGTWLKLALKRLVLVAWTGPNKLVNDI